MQPAKIVRIPILPFHMVNAHLIVNDRSAILVDAGLPGSEQKVERALIRHGLSWSDLKLIVVTHAHVDHAGAAARLRELSGAPIMAHRDDLDFYTRRRTMTFCPSGWVGKVFLKTPIPHEPYTAFEPDILLENSSLVDLNPYGVDGNVRHSAGHTAGSISVELSSHEALVGDLLASGILIGGIAFTGRAMSPPFEDDPLTIARELERFVKGGTERFHLGHGGPLGAAEVLSHARALSRNAAPTSSVTRKCEHHIG